MEASNSLEKARFNAFDQDVLEVLLQLLGPLEGLRLCHLSNQARIQVMENSYWSGLIHRQIPRITTLYKRHMSPIELALNGSGKLRYEWSDARIGSTPFLTISRWLKSGAYGRYMCDCGLIMLQRNNWCDSVIKECVVVDGQGCGTRLTYKYDEHRVARDNCELAVLSAPPDHPISISCSSGSIALFSCHMGPPQRLASPGLYMLRIPTLY